MLIDSPETGQDHENSLIIHEGLLEMARRYQVIVATNSLVFMRGGNLIDLGHETLPHLLKGTGRLVDELGSPGRKDRTAVPAHKKKRRE